MEAYVNRILKAVYTGEFREEAAKLAMTERVALQAETQFQADDQFEARPASDTEPG